MTNRKMSESGQPANNQNNHIQKSENSKKSLKKKGRKTAVLVKNLTLTLSYTVAKLYT